MDQEKIKQKKSQLAGEVIRLARNTLLVHLRFLDMALSRLIPVETDLTHYVTDGLYLGYDPDFVLQRYKQEQNTPVRDYLHVVFHCIFRHMFIHHATDQDCWDLACDVAVEKMITEFGLHAVSSSREEKQKEVLDDLSAKVKPFTAEALYRFFLDHRPEEDELAVLQKMFAVDDHSIWYLPPEERRLITLQLRASASDSGNPTAGGEDGDPQTDNEEGFSEPMPYSSRAEQIWSDISRRMQEDLQNFTKSRGTESGSMMVNLAEVNRERYDYSAFLKKFAVLGEVMKINDEEFDYVYYTYGLQLYEKMPLVEPLEYKDEKRIREFVIAIDTSGSTYGDLVQRFLQKTYNILQDSESFFSKINVHIIQCDADIQDDTVITCREDFDNYLKTMKLRGFGGTDFRPVFTYVDSLIWNKAFRNLKGLIYFTDGCGTFPEKKPAYETAFVFIDNGYNNYDVPAWAIKLILRKDEI